MAISTARVVIEVHNSHGKVSESDGAIPWNDIAEACSFHNATIARELYNLKRELTVIKTEVPPVQLFDRGTMTFPIGLLQRVTSELEGQGITVKHIDKTQKPDTKFNFVFNLEHETPRDYQIAVVDKLLAAGRFGMMEAPTGAGKTNMASLIVSKLGVRTLWVVHSADMVHQTADMLADYLKVKAGKIGAHHKDIRTVTVSTSQSLKTKSVQSLLETRKWKPDLILVDEVDHAGAWGVYQALRRFAAYYVYGFSATPFRRHGDKLLLEAGYGHVNAKVSLSDLQDQGYLAPITVRVREIGSDSKLPAGSAQSWQEVYSRGIVAHGERNRAIIEDIKALVSEGRQVLVNVDELSHIPALVGPDGIPEAIVVTGSEDPADRKVIYQAFRERTIPVLVGTVLRRGLNLPAANAVVLAGAKKSQTQTMQQLGRGLRPSAGKEDCVVQDYLDHHHGLLFEHSQQRFKTMQEAGFRVPEGMIREVEAPRVDMDVSAIDKIRKRQAALLETRLEKQNDPY